MQRAYRIWYRTAFIGALSEFQTSRNQDTHERNSPLAETSARSDANRAQMGHQSSSTTRTHGECPQSITDIIIPPSAGKSLRAPQLPQTNKLSETVTVNYRAPNIVIFGETGVGKSSIINLIAGENRAHISNTALGCTSQHERYIVEPNGIQYALWDTAGLDEGTQGTVPAELAESRLKKLVVSLAHSGGIHLVMYCIRNTRLTTALKRNYDLFYVTICRKKVPVMLVVTGLEYQKGGMEMWWEENAAFLQRCGMWFDEHACVTTLDSNDAFVQERRLGSQKLLRDLVVKYAERTPWKIEPSLIPWSLPVFRNIPPDGPVTGKKTVRRVVIYDCSASCGTRTRLIGDPQIEYEWVNVDTSVTPPATLGRAGVLVFYTSILLDSGISPEDVTALKTFYEVSGGKTCPMIVVLRGCEDDEVARMCWDTIAGKCGDIQAYCIGGAETKLEAMVERLCIEHVEVRSPSKLWRVYTSVRQFFAGGW